MMHGTWHAALLAALAGVSISGAGVARAELLRCTEQRVEYLIGGSADPARGRKVCASAPASRAAAAGGVDPHRAVKLTPDDAGRREILEQEMRKEREALAAMDRAAAPAAGTPEAIALGEQRARHVEDLKAIEAEIRRLR